MVNELVAQSYLGIVLRKPSDARRRKYKVWGELYDKIFSGDVVEPYVVSMLLYQRVSSWLLKAGLTENSDDLRRKIANNGVFHIARVAAYLWRGTDNWKSLTQELKEQIGILEKDPDSLSPVFEKAFEIVESVVGTNAHYKSDLDAALKTATLDSDLDKIVHAGV